MLANQLLWKVNDQMNAQSVPQSVSQPVPTVRVGQRAMMRDLSLEDDKANTDDRETKRVRFTEGSMRSEKAR